MKDWAMVLGRRIKRGIGFGAGVLLVLAWPVKARPGAQTEIGPRAIRSSSPSDSDGDGRSGEVVRAIDDPSTGNYWLLERDPRHPGGPGRMMLVSRRPGVDTWNRNGGAAGSPAAVQARTLNRLSPVIRAGDPLVVEENTPVVESRLEAVALGPAVLGAAFQARLRIGGKVVQAVALGAGRAAFADQIGEQP